MVTERSALSERLQVLEAVTDATLTCLDLDKVLATLLAQVLEMFRVDTATVLLHNQASGQLVAAASVGIEEEVWQGVRVPVGAGFAGRVAAARQPVILDRVDSTTVVNPLLQMKHLKALLGVPMLAGDELLGVLHVGSLVPRQFTDNDSELLQLVADRLALAVQLQMSSAERAAAAALQRSLLPGHLPVVPGLELAARYVPGTDTGVGGDWYDAFTLSDTRLGVAIGDVAGSGLNAAVVMGRLRSTLRAYALEFGDPAEVLGKLDRKASRFEQHVMATVGYMVIDTDEGQARVALAGHPPPVLITPTRPADFVSVPVDPPVGFGLAITGRRSTAIDLSPGSVLALYTDGLVERRRCLLDDGLDLLRQAIVVDSANAVAAHIMAAMVGTHPAHDDIALLVIRRTLTA
ncbi:MAG: SpoIIE family protein phosphatase [Kutzneria sp.]|nr:SpoIIE family protein phosphatase [Kutzneria sp.]MBV9844352.1 SpoIIE family protein phosphatase [Kutzneria sp.]